MFRLLAQTLLNREDRRLSEGVKAGMKELGNDLAQLVAIIMFMITLAVSTAALSQWASSDADVSSGTQTVQTGVAAPNMSATVNP